MAKRARSAIDGRFITLEEAKKNPKTSVIEELGSKSKGKTKKDKKKKR